MGKAPTAPPFDPTDVASFSYHGLDPLAPRYARGRKINQDCGCIVYPFGGDPEQALFAVLDGHGAKGDKAAEFAMEIMEDTLEQHPGLVGDEAAALTTAFVTADQTLATQKKMDPEYSGTTAVSVLMRRNRVWVANAGDSRCILATRISSPDSGEEEGAAASGIVAKALTTDQNPDTPGEQERIEKTGGFVSPPPKPGFSARVWSDPAMTQVGLAMARSIGDQAAKKVGVIADPEVKIFDLNSNDLFLILATDGVWEFISNQEAADIVWGVLQDGGGAAKATELLIDHASRRWKEEEDDYRDDITATVVTLPVFGRDAASASSAV
jgi:serine/threonine protein phosphatase PrpC